MAFPRAVHLTILLAFPLHKCSSNTLRGGNLNRYGEKAQEQGARIASAAAADPLVLLPRRDPSLSDDPPGIDLHHGEANDPLNKDREEAALGDKQTGGGSSILGMFRGAVTMAFRSAVVPRPSQATHRLLLSNEEEGHDDDEIPILANTTAFKACLGSLLIILVLVHSYLFATIIAKRKKTALELAQPVPLALFVLAGAGATGGCYLFVSDSDATCLLRDPVLLSSVTLMGAVSVGRAWRICSLLSPVAQMGGSVPAGSRESHQMRGRAFTVERAQKSVMDALTVLSEWWERMAACLDKDRPGRGRQRPPSTTRNTIPQSRLFFIVSVLTAPQIVLQILNLSVPSMRAMRGVHYEVDLGIARYDCQRPVGVWPLWLGVFLAVVPYCLAMLLNVNPDGLPQNFNEMNTIVSSLKVFAISAAVAVPSYLMAATPNARTYLLTAIVLGFVLPMCWFTVYAKLRLVWNGERMRETLVTRAFSQHQQRSSGSSSQGSSYEPNKDESRLESARLALTLGKVYENMGNSFKCIEVYDDALSNWKSERKRENKPLIGGFTEGEIRSLGVDALGVVVQILIEKGRVHGTLNANNHEGHRKAAQIWVDALDLFEKAPAAKHVKDRTIVFPCFSAIFVFLSGGKIEQDKDRNFEKDLVERFERETKLQSFHYPRALAMKCELMASLELYDNAFEAFHMMKTIYGVREHTEMISKEYGQDRCAQIFSQCALWYMQRGNTEQALDACEYVIENIVPQMNPKEVLAMNRLLFPVIRVLKWRGQAKRMRQLYHEHVSQNVLKYFGNDGFTPVRILIKPMLLLLRICEDINDYAGMTEDIDWILGGGGEMYDFADSVYTKLCWSLKSLVAEICLHLALRLDPCDEKRKLIKRGIVLSQAANRKMKDEEGNVKYPIAYQVHEPIMMELVTLAEENGLDCSEEELLPSQEPKRQMSLRTNLMTKVFSSRSTRSHERASRSTVSHEREQLVRIRDPRGMRGATSISELSGNANTINEKTSVADNAPSALNHRRYSNRDANVVPTPNAVAESQISLAKGSSICYAQDGYGKSFVDISKRECSSASSDSTSTPEVDGQDTNDDNGGRFSALPKRFWSQHRAVSRAKLGILLFLLLMTVITAVLTSYFAGNPNGTIICPIVVAFAFIFIVAAFLVYDHQVEKRQTTVIETVEKSSRIIGDHFPEIVRDRILSSPPGDDKQKKDTSKKEIYSSAKGSHNNLQTYLRRMNSAISTASVNSSIAISQHPPIADLFRHTTVLFADIAGFTAWSSEREPSQVFLLLERLFREFDRAARKYRVFKVETIGDCYLAVTGLPKPTEDHAVLMVAFAQSCLKRFSSLVRELEQTLGPGTAELGIRIGLHSGPVTAGVLRGKKSRFQLFGDTVNVASRIESAGERNTIHISSTTADLLRSAGKGHMLIAREDAVLLKGKGSMQTFFVTPNAGRNSSLLGSVGCISNDGFSVTLEEVAGAKMKDPEQLFEAAPSLAPFLQNDNQSLNEISDAWVDIGRLENDEFELQPSKLVRRLVTWNAAVLEKFIVDALVHRKLKQRKRRCYTVNENEPVDVVDAVRFPTFDKDYAAQFTPKGDESYLRLCTEMPDKAKEELSEYVGRIASTYQNVHFHNFEHASHVTMSANRLMNKISEPPEDLDERDSDGHSKEAIAFFNTYSISMDPLAQLAVVFASLIHDAGHEGVPNTILMKEKPDLAERYKCKSVAENNSIDLAWSILQEKGFANLRECMFENLCDERRFRQLLTNLLIATDIADKERMQNEKKRWERAFSGARSWEEEWKRRSETALITLDVSLKATVVLEQIMLASDVAHTMQHWLTFVKWNERLYKELWAAHVAGRNDNDPTTNWFEGQIGFFDFYIIPLARKLNTCGVFGSAGEEYLSYALSNRQEWTEKGEEITERFERTIRNAQILDKKPHYWEKQLSR